MSVRLGDKILAGISESDLRRSDVEDGTVIVAKAKDADTVDGFHANKFMHVDGSTPMTGNIMMVNYDTYYAMKKGRTINDAIHYLTVGVSAAGETTLEHYTEDKLDARLCLIGTAIGDYPVLSLMTNLGAEIATVLHTGNMANHVLPLTGGTLSGQLGLYGGYGQCNADENHVNIAAYNTRHDDKNHRAFQVLNSAHESDLAYALRIVQVSNGVLDKEAVILSTANKPTGTYIGNGNVAERVINTGGIGSVCMLRSSAAYMGFVTPLGAVMFSMPESQMQYFDASKINFIHGVLSISSESGWINNPDTEFTYQVL